MNYNEWQKGYIAGWETAIKQMNDFTIEAIEEMKRFMEHINKNPPKPCNDR